jgi:DNA-binding response OmpR family regulator
LIEKLRAEERRLPVIFVSAPVPVEELARHTARKLDATLIKPFTSGELLATVADVLHATEKIRHSSELFREAALQEQPARATRPGPMSSPQRILVVDDDSATRQVSVEVLVRSGYAVKAVQDGAAGWSALLNGSYDLVLTDNQMPRMTGLEMIEKLRAARMTLPVIMATRALPVEEFVRRPWLKPDAMIERPFSNDELLQAVKKILDRDDGSDDRRESLIPKYL